MEGEPMYGIAEDIATRAATVRHAALRLRAEYMALPRLTLSVEQSARLLSIEALVADAALCGLQQEGFLARTRDGRFVRRG
jgi:hypothetical protein